MRDGTLITLLCLAMNKRWDKTMTTKTTRPDLLTGATYKIKAPNGFGDLVNLYITVNNDDTGQPFEVFINCSDQNLYEWLTSIMVLISSMLRRRVPVDEITDDLSQICSSTTNHFIPGGGGHCRSLPARIAKVLQDHCRALSKQPGEPVESAQ